MGHSKTLPGRLTPHEALKPGSREHTSFKHEGCLRSPCAGEVGAAAEVKASK